MNSFYSGGFEDYKAKYLPELTALVQSKGIIVVLMMIDAEYQCLYQLALIPELSLQPGLVKIDTPNWFWGCVGAVGFAGLMEWLCDIVSAGNQPGGSTRDRAAVALLATQLRAKSQTLLVKGLKLTTNSEI